MSAQLVNYSQPRYVVMQSNKGPAQTKMERIPFASEHDRRRHQQTWRANGWEATYDYDGSDGSRDIYLITLTKLEF